MEFVREKGSVEQCGESRGVQIAMFKFLRAG